MPTQRKKIIKKEDVEDKISQIIYLAELNLECCKSIMDYDKKYKSDILKYTIFSNLSESKYLKLCSNNHFFEAVELISSLLYPSRDEEISFNLWVRISKNQIPESIKNLEKEFKNIGFLKIRNNIVAHKNIKQSGDLVGLTILLINRQLVDELDKITKQLKKETLKIFKDPIYNNYLLDNLNGLKNILDCLTTKIEEEIKEF
ncbi:MAG: hypothetical protein PHO28_02590 [Candidatus Pacebacteria bacterium]|nr:hypothetical protein [Candidatus Paceibacterota bacterium]